MFSHPQYPWMLADLDYLVEMPGGGTAILEIKTTNYNARNNWWYNGREIVPVYYESQGRHYHAIERYQKNIREKELKARYDRETAPWREENKLVPPIPKGFRRWVDKTGIPDQFIYYQYERGGAKTGYCSYCEKDVPIKNPRHNQEGRCCRCGHSIIFKSIGKTGLLVTPRRTVYLPQKTPNGFVIRMFEAWLRQSKGEYKKATTVFREVRRAFYLPDGRPLSAYYYDVYKQRELMWIKTSPCSPDYRVYGIYTSGKMYERTFRYLDRRALARSYLEAEVADGKSFAPEAFLARYNRELILDQIKKAGLKTLHDECESHRYWDLFRDAAPASLTKMLGLDTFRLKRLRKCEGGYQFIQWLRHEKRRNKPIPDEVIRWMCEQRLTPESFQFIIAIKPRDSLYETKLTGIEWNPSRSGEIIPVGIFDTVAIGGREISRASLHNLSFIEDLELTLGNRVYVSTRNMIIPHIEENLDRGGFDLQRIVPSVCPCCGMPTRIHSVVSKEDGEEKETKRLFCDNAACPTRFVRQFEHFTGEKALNVAGLSWATLEKLIGHGFLRSFTDIFRLDQHKAEIVKLDGFGEKSFQNLWDALQQSRNTTFERYLCAMDIPMIGNTASRALAERFHSSLDEFEAAILSGYDFTQLPDFGETLHGNIQSWFQLEEHWYFWEDLRMWVVIAPPVALAAPVSATGQFAGKTIVVTGKIEPYTRTEMNDFIASIGAVAGSSVTGKTNYLVCGEKAGSELDKARSLGITVLTPAEFFAMTQG